MDVSKRLGVLAVGLVAAVLVLASCGGEAATPTSEATVQKGELTKHLRSPHFVNSWPAHGETFATVPKEVVINFNFNLHQISKINVSVGDKNASGGDAAISGDQLMMRAPINGQYGDGTYVVKYTACWPDQSCHEGQFGFVTDSKTLANYTDMKGQSKVTIRQANIAFNPQNIIVDKGATVTWVNDDDVGHFVNTDPHPSHNVIADLNSKELNKGATFTYTFTQLGEWGYHCSAHQSSGMYARIMVRE